MNTFTDKQQRCRSLFLELNRLVKLSAEPSSKERKLMNQLGSVASGTTEFSANLLIALGIGVSLSPVSAGISIAALPLAVAALQGIRELYKILENKEGNLPRNTSEKESAALSVEMLLNEVAYLIPISYQQVLEEHLTTEGVDEFTSYAFSRVIKKLHLILNDHTSPVDGIRAYEILDYLRSSDHVSMFGTSATVTTTDSKSSWVFSNHKYAKRIFSRPKIAVLEETTLPDGSVSLDYHFYESPSQPEPKHSTTPHATLPPSPYGYSTLSAEELNLLYSGREKFRRKLSIDEPLAQSKLRSLYTASSQQLSDYAEKRDYAFIQLSTDPQTKSVNELKALCNQKLTYALFDSCLYYINERAEVTKLKLNSNIEEAKGIRELQALFPTGIDSLETAPKKKNLEKITLLTGYRGQSLNEYLSMKLGFEVIAQYRGKLQNISFAYGDYRNVYFPETEYHNCNFENSDWSHSILSKSKYDLMCNCHAAVYQYANFYRSEFNGLTLQGDFSHAWMCGTTLNNCKKGNMIEIGTDWRAIDDSGWQIDDYIESSEKIAEWIQNTVNTELQVLNVALNSKASKADLEQVLEKSNALQQNVEQLKKDDELLLTTLLTWRKEMDDYRQTNFTLEMKNASLLKTVDTLSNEIKNIKSALSHAGMVAERADWLEAENIYPERLAIEVPNELPREADTSEVSHHQHTIMP